MKPTTILIVEDNPITRKMVHFTLSTRGYAVLEAPDGKTALERMDDSSPDLVLQDLLLPDIDGFELVTELRKRRRGPEVPILAFSGFLSKLEEARISEVGFDDLITKPVEPSQLVRLVQAYLPAPREEGTSLGGGRRLLIVDDDSVQRKLAGFRLARMGFSVTTAADGQEALEQARAAVPDVVVTDIMMPRLDGFGLCAALRVEPLMAHIPILLMTNTYLDPADRELASRVGATRYLVRTPELEELVDALRAILPSLGSGSAPATPVSSDPPASPRPALPPLTAEVERERAARVLHQLENQVGLNAGMAQRNAQLAAELSVLSGISDALSRHQDIDIALDEVLAACFDAGGISMGALYLLVEGGGLRVRRFGSYSGWRDEDVASFFGHADLLLEIVRSGQVTAIPAGMNDPRALDVLARCGASSFLVVPLIHQDVRLGALLMMSKAYELGNDDRIAFARSVASQIAQALVLARTFDEKNVSEHEARRQAAAFGSIIESIADGIVVADEAGRIVLWNRSAGELAAIDPDKPAAEWAEHYGVYLPDQTTHFPAAEMPLVRAVEGASVDGAEIFLRPPGSREGRWLSVNARPVRDDRGIAHGGVAVIRDVTTEKSTQEQLTVSDRMASVGTLAAGVAHEINNPLASVVANLDLAVRDVQVLAERLGTPQAVAEIEAELNDARDAAQRLRQIVRDLKIFSRADEDRHTAVDIARVLESSLRMAWNEIRHRARLVKSYGQIPPVEANESRLGQVFLNLIINAAQAIDEGRAEENEIRVATRLDERGRVVVEIADTGHGMSAEVGRRLFTPFFTTKPIGIGTGLGLSICHRIVTALGGEIAVDTEVGKGTTFRVSLPAASITKEPAASARSPSPIGQMPRGRILIVDDEPKIIAAIRRTLSPDHDMVSTTRAAEALARIEEGERFDVILCDLMMPDMTGMDLYAELAGRVPEQARRVVFLTGGAFTPRAQTFLDETPNLRLEKPFDTDELRRIIAQRLRAGG